MKKHLSVAIVVSFSIFGATMQAALATPVSNRCDIGVHRGSNAGCSSRAHGSRYHRAFFRNHTQGLPYASRNGYWDSDGDPFTVGSGFCAYGSYVACVYSSAFCWQRCY